MLSAGPLLRRKLCHKMIYIYTRLWTASVIIKWKYKIKSNLISMFLWKYWLASVYL